MSGWFSINRAMLEHPIFEGQPLRVAAWVWLVGKAAWKDTKQNANGKTVEVKRGQILTSYRQMSAATGVPVQVLRTLVQRLTTDNTIATETNTGRLLITLCNYEKYQSQQHTLNTPLTQEQHSSNTQKNKGTINKGSNIHHLDDGFDAFWQVVPRKAGKGQARKAYKSALKKTDANTLRQGMKAYAAAVKTTDPQYIAHPSTWLNGERWLDDDKASDNRSWRDKPESEWNHKDRNDYLKAML